MRCQTWGWKLSCILTVTGVGISSGPCSSCTSCLAPYQGYCFPSESLIMLWLPDASSGNSQLELKNTVFVSKYMYIVDYEKDAMIFKLWAGADKSNIQMFINFTTAQCTMQNSKEVIIFWNRTQGKNRLYRWGTKGMKAKALALKGQMWKRFPPPASTKGFGREL